MSRRRPSYYRRALDWAIAHGYLPDVARRMAARHTRPGEPTIAEARAGREWTATFGARTAEGGAEVVVAEGVTYREAQRAGRWWADVRSLQAGDLSPERFRARWRRRVPIGGRRALADPSAALALAQQVSGTDVIRFEGPGPEYRRRRSRRGGR